MKISIIGTGYVGLVAGVVFSVKGHSVTCIDLDIKKIDQLAKAQATIHEKSLKETISLGLKNKSLSFSNAYDSIATCDVVFIAVGTPELHDGSADLSFIYSAIDSIAKTLKLDTPIVIKSSVPPTTCVQLAKYLKSIGRNNPIVMNPEFLREGSAIDDFINPARIVIGCNDERAKTLMLKVYEPWESATKILSDVTTAELIKYASNAFLATKVAFINEMSDICQEVEGDIETLSVAVGLDKRIGSEFLKVGPGFGGSCFPKDVNALIHLAGSLNANSKILPAVLESNAKRASLMLQKIKSALNGSVRDQKIAALGLSFKAGTDDVRCSPAVEVTRLIHRAGGIVTAFDPAAIHNAKTILPEINYANSAFKAALGARCLVILTEWPEFAQLDFQELAKVMQTLIIVDLRNMFDETSVTNAKSAGFVYHKLGLSIK
jgi:UDPglucose 6-dehydrogenase